MGRGPKRGHFSRSRSLEQFNEKFGQEIVQKAIHQAIASSVNSVNQTNLAHSAKRPIRVLEIGCGEGRVLLELQKLFPFIELHGINRKPWFVMKGAESLKKAAIFYKIFKHSEIQKMKLPKIHFYDAKKLHFPANYFDVVISQASIQYIDRKDQLLEEVWRVLKRGGKAFLNIDAQPEQIPDFLDFETPRFIIYKNNQIYPVRKLIADVRKRGYDITYQYSRNAEKRKTKRRINLIFTKNKTQSLKLNLTYVPLSSFNLNIINEEKDRWDIFWGYRSVYTL